MAAERLPAKLIRLKNDDGGKSSVLPQQCTGHLDAEIPMNRPWLVRKQLSSTTKLENRPFLRIPNPPSTSQISQDDLRVESRWPYVSAIDPVGLECYPADD